jgi:multimeric flavodoxin WrbA
MKLVIHDLSEQFLCILPKCGDEATVFSAVPPVKPCRGCFGCWIKSPGKCVIEDRGQQMVELLANHSEIVFISRLVFGSLSPDIKSVLDRSIGFLLPFFKVKDGKMRHKYRYDHKLIFRYLFYDSKG